MGQRSLGLEIEFFNVHYNEVIQKLKEIGIECTNWVFSRENTRVTTPYWKLVGDRSVTPDKTGADRVAVEAEVELGYARRGEVLRRGLELVSPVIRTPEDLQEVVRILEALKSIGAEVNSTCGLHIHVGVEDLDWYHIRALLAEFESEESFFDSQLPEHRRENNNKYCKSVRWNHNKQEYLSRESFAAWLNKCKCENSLKAQFGIAKKMNHDFDPKYKKLNVKGFFTNKTIEFRHLNGTLDFEVISAWMKTYLNMIDKIKNITLEEA